MKVSLYIFNSKVSHFLLKLFLFTILLFAFDRTCGIVLNYFYSRTKYGVDWAKENWLLDENFDIIIFGSSRAYRHYVPAILEASTGMSVFNAGQNGQYMLYAYALEQLLLDRYIPRIIILDVLPNFIVQSENPDAEFNKLDVLAHHFGNPEIKKLMTHRHPLNSLKYLSYVYRYNSKILTIADNFRKKKTNLYHGYLNTGQARCRQTNRFEVDQMKDVQYDPYRIEILKKFVKSARSRGVTVIASFSPTLEPLSPRVSSILQRFREIFHGLDVPFIVIRSQDYPEFFNKKYFMDYTHMNNVGAAKFTTIFAQKLMDVLRQDLKPVALDGVKR